MRTVTKRELNQRTAQVLAEVDDGARVVVTERGVRRWQIDAVDAGNSVAKLVGAGRIRPPVTPPAAWPDDQSGRVPDPAHVDAVYAASRGDH